MFSKQQLERIGTAFIAERLYREGIRCGRGSN